MFNRSVKLRGLVLLASTCLFSGVVLAAGPEVVGFGGGATYTGGVGTHGLFGGGASFGITDNVRLLGEFTYSPIASGSTSSNGIAVNATERLFGFGGGIEYSFLDSKSKARPYIAGLVGLDRLSATGTGTAASILPVSVTIGSNSVYYGVGGGLRYFIGKSWGIKPEVRYQRSSDTGNTIVYSVGLFYRFGE